MQNEGANRSLSWLLLLVPIAIFTLLRLPPLLHQPGGQDEQFFAVPGLTVLREGVPRIPYLPTRNRQTFFEGADRCLMALPPGLFYCQAPFFAVFPAGYPTARLPLFVAALLTICITFAFCRLLGSTVWSSAVAATLLAVSRPLLFTSITARPDLLCVLCGLASALLLCSEHDWIRPSRLIAIGLLCGLGSLFHPFSLVFCIQAGVAVFCAKATLWERIRRVLVVGSSAFAVMCLWIPLIALFPEEFRSQFFSNVLDRAGPGLPARLLWPMPALQHHAILLWEFAGFWQCLLLSAALVLGSATLWHTAPSRQSARFLALVWSSIYLTATVAGMHPTKGYWLYSSVLILVLFALAADGLSVGLRTSPGRLANRQSFRGSLAWLVACALAAGCMLPGAGLRSSWAFLRHWHNPEYHGRLFIHQVLQDLPAEGLFLADLSYVFDVYLSGRNTLLCQEKEKYWGDQQLNYRYILLAWEGKDAGWAKQYDARLSKTIGDSSTPQKCFIDIYVPNGK